MSEEVKKEDWMTKKWRPMMAIMYMTCCLFDFALFPIMFTVVQFWETQAANDAFRQWVPITLQGGGLFHVAMGAVLGVSAYGRTQEKVAGVAGGSAPATEPAGLPTATINPTPQPVNPLPMQNSFNQQPTSGFGSGFQTQAAPVAMGFGGKPAPIPPQDPVR